MYLFDLDKNNLNLFSELVPSEEDSKKIITKICKFIRDYFFKYNIEKAIIGLSGGIDSSLMAYLLVRALGNEKVHGVLLPSKFTSEEHIQNSLEISKILDIKNNDYKKIQGNFDKISYSLENLGEINKDNNIQKLKYGNIQARVRMILLRDIAKQHNGLVIGTTNKTEMQLGYATIAGDGSGGVDIEPISKLYKTTEKYIARYLNIPDKIIEQEATAELWNSQADEEELGMKYKLIDQVLLALEIGLEGCETSKKLNIDIESVRKIQILVENNSFKNRLAPTINLKNNL